MDVAVLPTSITCSLHRQLAPETAASTKVLPSFVQGWLETTSEDLKSIDGNHLVTFSSEGFLGSSTPGDPLCTLAFCTQRVRSLMCSLVVHQDPAASACVRIKSHARLPRPMVARM